MAYQPLFSFQDNSLLGFEALLRWPKAGSAIAGSICSDCGRVRHDRAHRCLGARNCVQGSRILATPVKVAVNLSPVQFRHGDISQSSKKH